MSRFFSSKYASLTPYTPGEQPRQQLFVKLNTNESPFPPSPKAQAMAKEAAENLQLYSDPTCKALVETAADTLTEPIGIAAVAAGFPASQTFIEVKIAEAAMAVAAGATEIDIVISIGKFLEGNYQEVFDEIAEIKAAIKDAHLKVILETGALKTAENIYKASILAMAAGADFIKTSTGKIAVNATPEATCVMCTAIKDWQAKTGKKVCYKPAGGVSTTEEAVQHYTLVKEILGQDWLNNESFRFGASRLANNLLTSITGTEVKYF